MKDKKFNCPYVIFSDKGCAPDTRVNEAKQKIIDKYNLQSPSLINSPFKDSQLSRKKFFDEMKIYKNKIETLLKDSNNAN